MIRYKISSGLLAAFLAAILLCGMLVSCAQKPETPAELLSLGEKYLTELDYENAIVQFLKVIEVEPMNERAYVGAAEAYLKLGDTGKAIEVLERGLAVLPDSGVIGRMLEELQPQEQQNSGEPEPALTPEQAILKEYCEKALTMDMDSAMEMLLAPEVIATVRDMPRNEHVFTWIELEGIYARYTHSSNPSFYVMYGPGSPEVDGIEHIVEIRFYEDMQIRSKMWGTRTYANGKFNGPYERRIYFPPHPLASTTLQVYTGNALDGYKHGEELAIIHLPHGAVFADSITYINGIAQITGPANDEGDLPIGISQETGEPTLYTVSDDSWFTEPQAPW